MIVRILVIAILLAEGTPVCVRGWNSDRSGRAGLSVFPEASIALVVRSAPHSQ